MSGDPFAWPEDARVADLRAERDAAVAALGVVGALATAACAERRRGCPTYGLVSAARVLELVEEAGQ